MRDLTVYEFHIYTATSDGVVSEDAQIERIPCFDEKSAKSAARKFAAGDGIGPVDLARAGPAPWADRYIGTAMRKWPDSKYRATQFDVL
ncbi:hypothetical protein HOU00_gp252 [Caulobacter phage CcrPW]|uniref:Uncharacterized protein n=1 Tax=Caulobacter phage CcrPW TaxID=2283271 RepID=A0A385EAQ5_9CAUD|nr:hypothetical protein HOU00_gp252 [Caulobacter phage CcrPW]AXQ68873.1 hypothetical protein CcrPW_gp334 [Caulobacter phage CcrPW]